MREEGSYQWTRDNFTPSSVEPSPGVWTGGPLTPRDHSPPLPSFPPTPLVMSPHRLTLIMGERIIVLEIFHNNQPFVLIIFTIYSVSTDGGKRDRGIVINYKIMMCHSVIIICPLNYLHQSCIFWFLAQTITQSRGNILRQGGRKMLTG